MMRLRFVLAVALVTASCAWTAPASYAVERDSKRGAEGKILSADREHLREVESFWTRERMRRARPIRPRGSPPPTAHAASAARGNRRGSPIVVPGGPPAEDPRAGANARSHVPFAQHEVPDTTVYPNSTNGKVFIKLGHGFGLGTCSATVVPTESRSVVLTAGHCVHDGGRRARYLDRKWTFVPGYRGGARPFGSFAATELWTTRGWFRRANGNYDIGAALLAPNEAGQRVEDVAGARGFAANRPRTQLFEAFGYPATRPFDGETLHVCDSRYAGDDRKSRFWSGPLPLRIDCDMKAGASGGAWVIEDSYVNSVTTHGYFGAQERNHLYGPYFGNRAAWLYEAVGGAT